MTQPLLTQSINISIIVQIITGAVGIHGIYKKLDPIHSILNSVLGWELVVQIFELFYYIFIIKISSLNNMGSIRYFDWVFTTPTMLITTIIYFTYENYLEQFNNAKELDTKDIDKYKKQLEDLSFYDFILKNKENILTIVICNFFMLLFGYLGEIGYAETYVAASFGFAFFFMSFYIIYDKYARFSKISNKMFKFLVVIWSLYGIAFLFQPVTKNITYNTLDIVAKNFFGLYLYFKILSKS